MEIGRLNEQDLAALAELYQRFRGEESSLEKMRATFGKLKAAAKIRGHREAGYIYFLNSILLKFTNF